MFEFIKEKLYDWSQPSSFQFKKEEKGENKSLLSADKIFESMYAKQVVYDETEQFRAFISEVAATKDLVKAIGINMAKAQYYYLRLDDYEKSCLRDYLAVKSNFIQAVKEMEVAYKKRKLKKKKIKAVGQAMSDLDYVINKSRFLSERVDACYAREIYQNGFWR